MSVNVKSLRIGSHVLVDGERVRVCGVTRRKVGYHPIGKPDGHPYYRRACEVGPIEIIGQLLAELGFKRFEHLLAEIWSKDAFHVGGNFPGGSWWCGEEPDVKVGYLHELEALYYLKHGVKLIKDEDMTDKLKLEDMTLAEIKELKKKIQRAMIDAMRQVVYPYDVGQVAIHANTNIDEIPLYFESCGGQRTSQSEDCEKVYTYHIKIKFSKEDD